MSATYRNPWFNGSIGHDPEFYTTDAKPVQVGRFLRYHRIKGSSRGGDCYDFVLDGVCVTQRAGPASAEIVESSERVQELIASLFPSVGAA